MKVLATTAFTFRNLLRRYAIIRELTNGKNIDDTRIPLVGGAFSVIVKFSRTFFSSSTGYTTHQACLHICNILNLQDTVLIVNVNLLSRMKCTCGQSSQRTWIRSASLEIRILVPRSTQSSEHWSFQMSNSHYVKSILEYNKSTP